MNMGLVRWDDDRIFFELTEWSKDERLRQLAVACAAAQKKAAEFFRRDRYRAHPGALEEVSEKKLFGILESQKDVHGISQVPEISNTIVFNAGNISDCVQSQEVLTARREIDSLVSSKLATLFGMRTGLSVIPSGHFWYPPGGYMGWHTNSKAPGWRLYVSYSAEDGKSFFRYREPDTGCIVTSKDSGLNCRLFRVSGDRLLWHAVYSETDRFSLGYLPRLEKAAASAGWFRGWFDRFRKGK
jgi:hypothetical protein